MKNKDIEWLCVLFGVLLSGCNSESKPPDLSRYLSERQGALENRIKSVEVTLSDQGETLRGLRVEKLAQSITIQPSIDFEVFGHGELKQVTGYHLEYHTPDWEILISRTSGELHSAVRKK